MISTTELAKRFGSNVAVRDLDLIVESGELFGFLGPNGAGKTTTIRMLVGLLRPTRGTAAVAGHDVERNPLAVKRAVGYLAQTPFLYEQLTGREFLRFVGGLFGFTDKEIDQRSEKLLGLVDLSHKGDELIESYSGGMKHKIGLCAAMLHEPQVLILDEPLAGMDPYGARRVKRVLRDLCRKGVTIFMSTHILEVAERVCDRVGILNQGQLVAVGTTEELRSLAAKSSSARVSGTTLEDLFVELTGGDSVSEVASLLA
jgi:ABC-2 type transport system ATP-binding protein